MLGPGPKDSYIRMFSLYQVFIWLSCVLGYWFTYFFYILLETVHQSNFISDSPNIYLESVSILSIHVFYFIAFFAYSSEAIILGSSAPTFCVSSSKQSESTGI